jgi:hypothetical protein
MTTHNLNTTPVSKDSTMKPTAQLYSPIFVTEQQYRTWLYQQVKSGAVSIDKLKSIPDSIAHVTGHQYKRVLVSARRWANTQ